MHYKSDRSAPAILFIHQCDREGDPTGFEPLVSGLIAANFNVLDLDLRGYGKSLSNKIDNTSSSMFQSDVELAYQFLQKQENVKRDQIAVIGASCGASQAIFLARKHKSVKALVFISGSFWKGAVQAFEEVADLPLLIATSEQDRVTERMKEAFSKSNSPDSKLIIYKGDAHGTPLFEQDPYLPVVIEKWLVQHLVRKSR